MNDQYPPARSLKDDPPPIGAVVLLYHSVCRTWHRSPLSDSDAERFGGGPDEVWTHWLPMPPDPPKTKSKRMEKAWHNLIGIGCYPAEFDDKDFFKAGWNAALDMFDKEWRTDAGLATPLSELLNHLKAP